MTSANKDRPLTTPDSGELEILKQQFPHFTCLCELCDCGCVQRKGGHFKNCRKKNHKKLGDDKGCLLSHYQQTFKRPENVRHKRLPMIPPPTPRDYGRPPMDFSTTQRTDYQQQERGVKAELLKQSQNYETSDLPMANKTSYNQSFTRPTSFPQIKMTRPGTQRKPRIVSAKFDSRTTNKEAFKIWVPQPAMSFQDLPSFAGSILYPGKTLEELRSTTQVDYPGAVAPRPQQLKMAPGNLMIEGPQDLCTTHRLAFTDMGTGHKATNARHQPQMNTNRKAKFDGQTQTMKDFSRKSKSQPLPPPPVDPAPSTIRLSYDSGLDFTTEQRAQYGGHDMTLHRRPNIMKKEGGNFDSPKVKFHTDTTHKVTYLPMDIRAACVPKSKPIERAKRIPTSAKFDDQTVHRRFYKNWGTQPRVRYGNIREHMNFMPPREPMEMQTSTTAAYKQPAHMIPTKSFKPENKPMAHTGRQDFTTVHKETYRGVKPKLCKAQMFLLQKEMMKQNEAKSMHKFTVTV